MNYVAHTEEYKGFKIEISHDDCAENPFEAWDCEPLIFVNYDRSIKDYGYNASFDSDYLPSLTRVQIIQNISFILDKTGHNSLRELREDYYNYSDIVDAINDALQEAYNGEYNSEKLDFYSDILNIIGVENYLGCTSGYSQGDYAEVLVIACPNWIKHSGIAKEHITESLEYAVKLFGYWAWGDVYGYSVEDSEGELIDSCNGYYGDYSANYGGAIEEARHAIDWHVKHLRKKRIDELKTLIKNRVPLYKREEILEQFAA